MYISILVYIYYDIFYKTLKVSEVILFTINHFTIHPQGSIFKKTEIYFKLLIVLYTLLNV